MRKLPIQPPDPPTGPSESTGQALNGIDPEVPAGDPLHELPPSTRAAIVASLGVRSAAQLLQVPDHQIRALVKDSVGCGERVLVDLTRWLCQQRMARGELVGSPLQAKAHADDIISRARHDIARELRRVIERDRLAPEEVARRCGTSCAVVLGLMAGSVPASLDLVLRLAATLGVRVRVDVL